MQTIIKELQSIAVNRSNLQKRLRRLERKEKELMDKLSSIGKKEYKGIQVGNILWDTENVFIPDEELQEGMWNHEGNTYMTQDAAIKYGSTLKEKRLATNEDHIDLNKAYDGGIWDDEKKGRWFGDFFFPAAGLRGGNTGALHNVGTGGYYWSASPNGAYGCGLSFNSTNVVSSYNSNRANGFSVRCVSDLFD